MGRLKKLVYTFANFPHMQEVAQFKPFIFHKLKADFENFSKIANGAKPDYIIGIAKARRRRSTFETQAVNIFNTTKKVNQQGREKYVLDYPKGGYRGIVLRNGYTDTFCNWTMYKIAEIVAGTKTKLQFVHVSRSNVDDFVEYFERAV